MNVSFTSRGFELSDQIKKYAKGKIQKLESLDQLIDVTLTLEHSKHLYKAELLVHNRNARFNAVESTPDVFASMNTVIDKVQKQLKKHKEKLIGRKRKAPAKGSHIYGNMAAGETSATPRVIRARRRDVKPMTQEEAVLQLSSREESFLIFRDTNSDRIHVLFKRKDGNFGLVESEV